ncbi:hypothetical protein SAPIO_CDS6958 [Scedosporium apiospermum]|uniref:Conidiation-specific protein 6 n=1 Tax=Pseudallescheria apiosperma TaxID=563466 RepID=A0A084G2T1_PSEDA|nr:uncharacterized protein SAPIO_CDS6958 [Scedosporium apiospermum]KEZ41643.1 hypothetical protein SAPIO_CDS6958 [Scedosporium apiospermum]
MEDRSNRERGLKAAIHNPHVSEEAKQHAREALKNEFGEEIDTSPSAPSGKPHPAKPHPAKDPEHVARGLKGATHNPRVSEEAKREAQHRLDEM